MKPVQKSIFVRRRPEDAFRLFTEMQRWWPLKDGMSWGGDRANEIIFEGRVGGRFFERYRDGEEYEVGRVTVFDPPARVVFTWKAPSWDASTEVEVRFAAEADGTRVTLEHRGWERLTEEIRRKSDGYDRGWDFALSRFAA